MSDNTPEMFCNKCSKDVPVITHSLKNKTIKGVILAFFGFAPGVQHSEPTHKCSICKTRITN